MPRLWTVGPHQACFWEPRGGCWWAVCTDCSTAVETSYGVSPWPPSCAGGWASQAEMCEVLELVCQGGHSGMLSAHCRMHRYQNQWSHGITKLASSQLSRHMGQAILQCRGHTLHVLQ